MQAQRGLVPPRVVGRGGGLRAETSGAMFSTGRGSGNDKGKGKVFGK